MKRLARQKLVEKNIDWVETYTDKTLFLKRQFNDVIGPGSYYRFEGQADDGSEYYCILGPANIHKPRAKFFAGVRKLPATYSAGGKYFDSLSEAAKLSNNVLVEGIISDIVTVDTWFRHLPFVVFEGLAYTFTREATLASADFASPGTDLNQTKYQAGATFDNVNVNLSAILADIIIDGQVEDQFSETNDLLFCT